MTEAARQVLGFRSLPAQPFLQITIDGIELTELVPRAVGMSTVFNSRWAPGPAESAAAAFLGRGPQDPRLAWRQILLAVCPHCGDVECGALVADLRLNADEVTWSGFSWTWGKDLQEFYTQEEPQDFDAGFARELRFERAAYGDALQHAVEECLVMQRVPEGRQRPRWLRWKARARDS